MDFTIDFCVLGQFDHPDVASRIRQIEGAAERTGTIMNAFVGWVERASSFVAAGYS